MMGKKQKCRKEGLYCSKYAPFCRKCIKTILDESKEAKGGSKSKIDQDIE